MKNLKFVLIGAGMRGQDHTLHSCRDHGMECVAVADPSDSRRNFIRDTYGVKEEMCFTDYKELLAQGKIADFAVIATQDKMHLEPALMAIELGYDLLLEKPIATTPEECVQVWKAAEKKGVRVLVCHVLRYTPFMRKVKDLIDEGHVGKIMSVIHTEGVGNIHQSHSYVRGNWHKTEDSSNMLLAKSSHDLDILQWLLGSKCKKIQSFGGLHYFTKENCPEGAPYRCIDGCPHGDKCAYNAVKLYLESDDNYWFRPVCANKLNPTDAEVEQAIRTNQYGVCVFQGDNDVVDHQTVNMEFENGETVVFTMTAFNLGGRRIRIMGTKGEICSDDFETIELVKFFQDDPASPNFGKPETTYIKTGENTVQEIVGGHGGGDAGIIDDLALYFGENKRTKSISGIGTSVMNHLYVFAAEKSRAENIVVDMDAYIESISNCI